MTPQRWRKVKKLFSGALEIQRGRNRAGYLAKACAHDRSLRAEVESLLERQERDRGFLATGFSLVGKTLMGYQVIEEIGHGGIGVVYRAWDALLRRFVVFKVLPPIMAADRSCRARFRREAQCAAAIRHPNVVTVYGVGRHHGAEFIVMEYVPGKSLDRVIPACGLPVGTCLNYALQIAQALAKAHASRIIHRDLKPANIVVSPDGWVKVLDFGLAKPLSAGRGPRTAGTQNGTILGTAGYMSPEQVRGRRADARSDVFAFGAVFHEMLTGRRAFVGASAVETMMAILAQTHRPLPSRIPPEVANILRRCLEADPQKRFRTMGEAAAELSVAAASYAQKRRSPHATFPHPTRRAN